MVRPLAMLRLLVAEQAFDVGLAELIDTDFIALRDAGLVHVVRVSGGTYLVQITPAGREAIDP